MRYIHVVGRLQSGAWKQDVDAATREDLRGLFLPRCISHLGHRGQRIMLIPSELLRVVPFSII